MFISFVSEHLALMAIAGGIVSAAMNTVIEDLLSVLIEQTNLEIRQTLLKSLIASFTVGLLLSIIYYSFALYGFTESSLTPIQIIFCFTILFGLGYPLLSAMIKLFNSWLLTKDV